MLLCLAASALSSNKMKRTLLLVLCCATLCLAGSKYKSKKYIHPLSDQFIDHINAQQSTWKVILLY